MSDEITPNPQTPSADALADKQTEPQIDPISESVEVAIPSEPEIPAVEPETQTPQIPVNEPLLEPVNTEIKPVETTPEELPLSTSLPEEKPSASSEPVQEESKSSNSETSESKKIEPEKEISETKSETKPEPELEKPSTESENIQADKKVIPIIISTRSQARELLIKARNAIQFRKRKKLDRVLSLFAKQTKITNDEIEKFLHVSDATATRYLSQLEKEGKIKQIGKTGKSVYYYKL